MIGAVLRIQRNGLLRHVHGVVPEFKLEVDTAKQVVGSRVIGSMCDGDIQRMQSLVGLACLERSCRLIVCPGCRAKHKQKNRRQPELGPQRSTTFMSMPL